MRHPVTWFAAGLMLIGAVMLVTEVGAAGIWIALIAMGIALVAVEGHHNRQGHV